MSNLKGFDLKNFYSKIYKRYDIVNRLFTFGLDRKWRVYTAEKCLQNNPEKVLDLCCGTGDLTLTLCNKKDNDTSVVGFDFNSNMLQIAKQKTQKKNFKNIDYIEGDASDLPFKEGTIDSITIGFGFRNLMFNNPRKDQHLIEIFRVLKPGGTLLILESGVPSNFFIRFFYTLYLYLFLIPLGALISGNGKAYWYLAHSSSKFYSISEVKEILMNTGFTSFEIKTFFLGAANVFEVKK